MNHEGACARDFRLVSGRQFDAVFAHKRRWHGARVNVHFAPNELSHARIGLAVSRRVSKKAVERNRIKRIIRASFRECRDNLGAVDFVVIAKAAAVGHDLQLRAELDAMWRRQVGASKGNGNGHGRGRGRGRGDARNADETSK